MAIRTIDFHGYTLDQVKLCLEAKLNQAISDGEGIVRLIHGQGKHSEIFPVIKSYIRHWLEESDFAQTKIEMVLRGEDGTPYTPPNPGETIVLLKVSGISYDPEISWEDEEEEEARRKTRRFRSGKNKSKYRQKIR